MPDRTRTRIPQALLAACLALTLAPSLEARPMEEEQLFEPPERERVLHPRMEELIGLALQRPEELTRLEALADAIRLDLTGLSDQVVELLEDPDAPPLVRTTAAQAAGALDARGGADALLQMIQVGPEASPQRLEQAAIADDLLARWEEPRATDIWAQRLTDENSPARLRGSAADALGHVPGDNPAQTWQALHDAIVDAGQPIAVRLAAAGAMARLTDLESDTTAAAAELIQSDRTLGPLLATRMLQQADSDPAIDLLDQLAEHENPAVQGAALDRMLQIDPQLLWPDAERTIRSDDPKVRLMTVRSLETRDQTDTLPLLAESLNDPHPEVRNTARQMMRALAVQGSLMDPVKGTLREIIGTAIDEKARDPAPHWRAAEQAALLLGTLDDKPSADALVSLFDHSRNEVRVAAVVALRDLEVESTRQPMVQLLETVIDRAQETSESLGNAEDDAERQRLRDMLTHDGLLLIDVTQTLGVWDVQEADAPLRELIPKGFPTASEARTSAIWALGLLHEGQPDDELARTLFARATDRNPLAPEANNVRFASLVAIGRMEAGSQTGAIESDGFQQDPLAIQAAARWALINITGQDRPPLNPAPIVTSDAFLSPLD